MHLTWLECTECPSRVAAGALATTCPECGMPLRARYDLERVRESLARDALAARPGGLWRWRELLPLSDPARAVSLGEGSTPLLPAPRLGARLDVPELFIKDESQNPTGSFKARGMSVAVSMARALGARAIAAPSAGNAGGALAAYGARAGLEVHIFMPSDVPAANLLEARACGAEVTLVDGTIADCGRRLRELAPERGWFDVATLREPYRVEGKKTMGLELAEDLAWELPDVVLYPTGGGTGLLGIWKAFAELRELGWIAPDAALPRMVAVQARGCAPVVDAFGSGAAAATPPAEPRTVASGLRVPTPLGDRWMLRVLRESSGTAVAVDDDELVAGARLAAKLEGVFFAPEAGALVAALRRLRADGWLESGERVVLFNTGTGLKYPQCFE